MAATIIRFFANRRSKSCGDIELLMVDFWIFSSNLMNMNGKEQFYFLTLVSTMVHLVGTDALTPGIHLGPFSSKRIDSTENSSPGL